MLRIGDASRSQHTSFTGASGNAAMHGSKTNCLGTEGGSNFENGIVRSTSPPTDA
jgi:hypothetical protein